MLYNITYNIISNYPHVMITKNKNTDNECIAAILIFKYADKDKRMFPSLSLHNFSIISLS